MSDIIRVRRANVILKVSKEQQSEYLNKGFDVIDDKGKVVTEATTSNDVSVLHQKLSDAQAKIKDLEKENEKLKKQLAPKEPEEEFDEIDDFEEVPEEKPAKKGKK